MRQSRQYGISQKKVPFLHKVIMSLWAACSWAGCSFTTTQPPQSLINTGDYVNQGTVLFEVANLSSVWVLFDAYESDLPFLKVGNRITFSLQALPETHFSANIRFMDPVMDPTNRVAKVRVEAPNPSGQLKPEMFANGLVQANLTPYKNKLVIPSTAVLWTGKRSIVYVKQSDASFKLREVELGPMLSNSYVILSGLSEGEEIVTEGTFSVDAAAQLEGKKV